MTNTNCNESSALTWSVVDIAVTSIFAS